jgi:cellulose synthase/poly-beta-1,6-N-acetylglucosamine synthase-like glycosyltransferase
MMTIVDQLILLYQEYAPVVRGILDGIHEVTFPIFQILLIPMIFFSVYFYFLAFTGIFLKSEKRKYKRILDWPMVTVQIPTFNEPVAIRCAKKCLDFDYPKDKLEVIIGDDSNDANVSRLIDDFAKKHNRVKVTRRGSNAGFKPGNLNHMLKYSKGDIIVVFDSDFVPPRNFLKKVIPPFLEDERVACVQAKWKFLNVEQTKVSKLASAVLMVYQNILAVINHKNGVSLLFGSAEAVRKDVLLKLGGWKFGSLTEDVEFSVRVLKKGYKVVYVSDFGVPGEVPFTLKGYYRQQKRWAYGNVKAFLEHARWLLFGKSLSIFQKSTLLLTLLGYLSAPFLIAFTLFGIISFMTGNPEVINLVKFFKETVWLFLVNGGFLFAAIVALSKENKLNMIGSVLASTVTVGLCVSVGIMIGIFNAILGKKMGWMLIEKDGNRDFKTRAISNSS